MHSISSLKHHHSICSSISLTTVVVVVEFELFADELDVDALELDLFAEFKDEEFVELDDAFEDDVVPVCLELSPPTTS